MEQLVQTLGDQTRLTVAVDLTAPDERIETHTAGEWRRRQLPEMNRRPAIFIIGSAPPCREAALGRWRAGRFDARHAGIALEDRLLAGLVCNLFE